jgi:hypothetical protein
MGRELARHIVLPISHLRTEARTGIPDQLAIDIWDENIVIGNGSLDSFREDGEWYETTLKSPDGRFIGQRLPYTVSCFDRQCRHIVASIAWNERISNYERAKPLARLLLEWHNDRNVQMIHAALVARHDQGLLVVGKRGAGKSTFALACIIAGLDYVSEDFVGLERRSEHSFVGHGLYNSLFLEAGTLAEFGDIIPYGMKSPFSSEEKSAVILSEVFPERLKSAVSIRAVAVLCVADVMQPTLRPASKGEALLALGPSSLLQIPNRQLGTRGFARLTQLVEEVPCYRVQVGATVESAAASAERVLTEVGAI